MEAIKDGLIEKMPIKDQPQHERSGPAQMPPMGKGETAKQGGTSFKIK